MKAVAFLFSAAFLLVNISGCAPLIVGAAAGGVGVYAASKDTIEGDIDKPYDNLWNAAVNVSTNRGVIKYKDYAAGYIEVSGGQEHIWIRLARMTRSTVRLRISSRKLHFPNIGLAGELFSKIVEEAG